MYMYMYTCICMRVYMHIYIYTVIVRASATHMSAPEDGGSVNGGWLCRGLHHTSFTCTIHHSQHQRFFCFACLFLVSQSSPFVYRQVVCVDEASACQMLAEIRISPRTTWLHCTRCTPLATLFSLSCSSTGVLLLERMVLARRGWQFRRSVGGVGPAVEAPISNRLPSCKPLAAGGRYSCSCPSMSVSLP